METSSAIVVLPNNDLSRRLLMCLRRMRSPPCQVHEISGKISYSATSSQRGQHTERNCILVGVTEMHGNEDSNMLCDQSHDEKVFWLICFTDPDILQFGLCELYIRKCKFQDQIFITDIVFALILKTIVLIAIGAVSMFTQVHDKTRI